MRLALAHVAASLLSGCATLPPTPQTLGETYRALGTEPFWSLELTGREMIFTEANAPDVRIVQPQPRPIIGVAGEIYQSARINVNIVHMACSDGMSDRIYPDKVQVRVDDRSFEGCGGEPRDPRSLAGRWQVLSVEGIPTSGDQYIVEVENGRLNARFGCNRMSGNYRVEGETLRVGPIAATRMACPDMRAEAAAAAILAQPMRITWTRNLDLVLRSEAGDIRLREVR